MCCGTYHEKCHEWNTRNKGAMLLAFAEDSIINHSCDKIMKAYIYIDKGDCQRSAGIVENFGKAVIYSPTGPQRLYMHPKYVHPGDLFLWRV